MHVMIATRCTQGQRYDDYARTIDGELAFLPIVECDWGGAAGFRRGARYFIGLESREHTTTAQIITLDIEAGDVVAYVAEKLGGAGWRVAERAPEAQRLAHEMLGIAARFPVGTVVEKRGNEIRARSR